MSRPESGRLVHFIITGGTIQCELLPDGKLAPREGVNLFENAGVDKKKFQIDERIAYVIDSQIFDIKEHGSKIIALLEETAGDGGDVVITTGTDTIKWLSALIRNYEKDKNPKTHRRVILLSSMLAPIDKEGKDHVNKLVRAGFDLVETSKEFIPDGVYVAAAVDISANKINFLNVDNSDSRFDKVPELDTSRLVGSDVIVATLAPGKISWEVEPISVERKLAIVGASEEEERLKIFIKGCCFRRLPTLHQSDDKAVLKYFQKLGNEDVVAMEIGKTWLDKNGKITAEKMALIETLKQRGIKIVLNNRAVYKEEVGSFESYLNPNEFESVKQQLKGREQSVCVIGAISTNAAYMRLADLDTKPKVQEPSGARESKPDECVIGLSYLPSVALFKEGFANSRGDLPKNVVIEILAGGVVPKTLVEQNFIEKILGQNVQVAGTYKTPELKQSVYDTAADILQLMKDGVSTSNKGASDVMAAITAKRQESGIGSPNTPQAEQVCSQVNCVAQ